MFYALVGCWNGLDCAIPRGCYVPPFSRWERVPEAEYFELLAEGFIVAMSWAGPGEAR